MDDVSHYFKNGFLSLHKNKIEKNYQQKTLTDRMNTFKNIRRETRNTLMLQKRNIDVNMTPLNTPEPSKIIKKAVEKKQQQRPNKRLEMLNKWKADKEKRKQEEKQKAKPLFKVYHVPVSVGFPDLEKVNKEIKGKPISQFAPPNHKFHAPKNIKPISLSTSASSHTSNISTHKTNLSEKKFYKQRAQNSPKRVTRSQTLGSTKLKQDSIITQKLNVGASSKKITSNKVTGKNNKCSTTGHSVQQNNTKQSEKSRQMYKKADLPKTVNSASGIFKNSKSTAKCSPPKKSKKTNNQNLSNERENGPIPVTSRKNVTVDKIVKSQREKIVDSASEIKFNITNLNSKIKYDETNDTTVKENENQIEKDQEELKISIVKTPTKPLRYIRKLNIECNKIEVPYTGEKKIHLDEYEPKTPTNNRKSTNMTYKKDVDWKMTKVSNTPIGKNQNKIDECEVKSRVKSKEDLKTPIKSRKSINESSKKNVGWNVIEIVDSDNEILSENVCKTPKANTRKYKKTPRRGKKSLSDDMEMEETLQNDNREMDSSPTTPKNNRSENISTSPVYISPFVTISRGKTSARKEYKVRHSPANVPDNPEFNRSITNSTSPKAGADYFSRKLGNEITRIESLCKDWSTYRNENNVPDEANDMIDVAIGQSNLLISKKFEQFKSLIEQCRNYEYLEKPITCEDLHGFWDMIYMQVEDLDKRFKNLSDLKENNWKEVIPEKKPIVKRGRGRPKKATGSSSLRNMIKAAREKKKSDDSEANQQQPTLLIPQSDDAKIFSGGYYAIKSPIKELDVPRQSSLPRASSSRRSLRVSLLAHQMKNRLSSPGLTMMKVSQAIKSRDGLTPSKSILKSDLTKSATRITKSVLFKDNLEEDIDEKIGPTSESLTNTEVDKENDCNEMNLIIFSPQTPTRRSRRVTKSK